MQDLQGIDSQSWVRLGPTSVHLPTGDTRRGGQVGVSLTSTELRFIQRLLRAGGQVVPDEELLVEVFGYTSGTRTRTHVTTASRIRKKIETDPSRPVYLCRESDGYRLVTAPLRAQPPLLGAHALRLVGRESLLASLVELDDRVVSLLGPGGVGKTALAQALSSVWAPGLSGGAIHLRLAQGTQSDHPLRELSRALGLPDTPGRRTLDAAASAIQQRGPCLIVADACERQVGEIRSLVEFLEEAAPQARFLLTSRIRLAVQRERVVDVPPLTHQDTLELLRRATEKLSPGWLDNSDAAVQVADWLDGLPLAVELVAARARVMSVTELAARLSKQTLNIATKPARHRSLTSVMQECWSQLDAVQQGALVRLAVWPGPFDLPIAETMLDDAGPDALDLLQVLVDRCMVRRVATPSPHFRITRIVRRFLDEVGDTTLKQRAAAVAQRALLDRCRSVLERAPQVADPTLALFVPALEHQLEAGSDPNDQAILNAVLCWLASDFGAPGDLIRQSGEVLDRTTSAQDGMHLRWGMARLTRVREQAEALLHDLPSDAPRRSVLGLHAEWMMTEPIGQDSESCRAWLVEAEQMSDPLLLAHLNYCLGVVETSRGEIAEGQAALARALAMSEHAPALATSLNVTQAITFALIGEKEKAIGIFRSLIDGPVHVTPRVRALAALHLSRTLNTQGLAAAARNAARQARGLVLHLHAPNVAAACSWTEADALLELNMIPEALASYEAAAELYTHMPGHWGSSMMVCFRIRACLIGGQATDDLRVELAPLISDPNPMVASSAKGFMAILDAVDSGPTEATAEALEASLSDLNSEAAARPWWYLHGLTRPALWWAVNRPDRAHAALEEAVEQFRHMHVTPALRGAQQLQERFSGLDKTGEDRSSFLRMAERVLPNR